MADPKNTESDFSFGCYEPFYKSGISYLGLLNLCEEDEVVQSIGTLSQLASCDTWQKDTIKLLGDIGWRSHLPPLVSYLSSNVQSPQIEDAIWGAVERGSWVSPQLLCGLNMKQFDFKHGLSQLLNAGVNSPNRTALELHVATGPGDDQSRLGKIRNSLKGLGITDDLGNDRQLINEAIAEDFDEADEISYNWHNTMTKLIRTAQQ
ncbi:MAG: hypothetical protein Q9M28_09460 [Mariprofundaceae bacterium]|nr:hypothetical protein [Mariprofundaceae bacterium]